MSETVPLLQEIHDQFDTFDQYGYTDHSMISNIAIAHSPDGYRVTTYPGGCGYRFDGLAIDLTVPNGMFGGGAPTRVETSRDYGPLMVINVGGQTHHENGAVEIRGTLTSPAAREGLALPGDPGFELFAELHNRMQGLRAPLRNAVVAAGVAIEPMSFDFKESAGSCSYDHDAQIATHHRKATYLVQGRGPEVQVKLDATVQTPLREKPGSIVVYNAGSLTYEHREAPLSGDALLAFTGLHAAIRSLYA